MTADRRVYGEFQSKNGLKQVFTDIRKDVENAKSRPTLTDLYKRAGYLITLTYAPSWKEKFGKDVATLRQVGKEEFSGSRRLSRCRTPDFRPRGESTRSGEGDPASQSPPTEVKVE